MNAVGNDSSLWTDREILDDIIVKRCEPWVPNPTYLVWEANRLVLPLVYKVAIPGLPMAGRWVHSWPNVGPPILIIHARNTTEDIVVELLVKEQNVLFRILSTLNYLPPSFYQPYPRANIEFPDYFERLKYASSDPNLDNQFRDDYLAQLANNPYWSPSAFFSAIWDSNQDRIPKAFGVANNADHSIWVRVSTGPPVFVFSTTHPPSDKAILCELLKAEGRLLNKVLFDKVENNIEQFQQACAGRLPDKNRHEFKDSALVDMIVCNAHNTKVSADKLVADTVRLFVQAFQDAEEARNKALDAKYEHEDMDAPEG